MESDFQKVFSDLLYRSRLFRLTVTGFDSALNRSVQMIDLTDGSIILMHDIHEPSVQAAIQVIPQLVEKGYKLMTVSELAKAKGVELQNASYSNFWDSSLSKGLVAGYDGPLLNAETASEGGDGSDISDGSSEEGSGEGSDMSDGSGEDGSGEDYSDGSGDEDYYDDGGEEEYY